MAGMDRIEKYDFSLQLCVTVNKKAEGLMAQLWGGGSMASELNPFQCMY